LHVTDVVPSLIVSVSRFLMLPASPEPPKVIDVTPPVPIVPFSVAVVGVRHWPGPPFIKRVASRPAHPWRREHKRIGARLLKTARTLGVCGKAKPAESPPASLLLHSRCGIP